MNEPIPVNDHDPENLWYTRCPLPTASGIAIDSGVLSNIFTDIGMDIRSIAGLRDSVTRNSHFDHCIPRLFRQGGNIPPIWARSRGADTAVVALAWTQEYQAILARPDSDIRSLQQLKGARLALPHRSDNMIDFWQAMCLRGYRAALDLAHLSPEDVIFVPLSVEERYIDNSAPGSTKDCSLWSIASRVRRQRAEVLAFVRGEVDALYTSDALGKQLAALLDARELVDLGFHKEETFQINNQVPNVLTVDRRLALEHPDLVARYLKALSSAAAWAVAHPSMAQRIVAREVGTAEEWVPLSYGPGIYKSLPLDLDERKVEALSSQKLFLLDAGFIDCEFSIDEWILREPMDLLYSDGLD